VRCSGLKAQNILAWGNALRYDNNEIAGQARNDEVEKQSVTNCNGLKLILLLLTFTFFSTLVCKSQNINIIRSTNWLSVDYVKDMENYLPCECFDSINYCYYISISKEDTNTDEYGKVIPDGLLNYVIQTEPFQFYILFSDSTKYIISRDSENKAFELTLNGDTLLLTDSIDSRKFIKSVIPFNYFENEHTYSIDNITLLNKSLSSRGYPDIQVILKADDLIFYCNAWLGERNMIYSYKDRKLWVLEIKNGYLYIEKVTRHRDPSDLVKTKVIKKLKWITNGKERLSRKNDDYRIFYPIENIEIDYK